MTKNIPWFFSGIGSVITNALLERRKENPYVNEKQPDSVIIESTVNNYIKTDEDLDCSDVLDIVDRFISLYDSHGVKLNQIPRYIDKKFKLRIYDLKSRDSILKILSLDLLDYSANEFCVSSRWLDCSSDQIYKTRSFYKHIDSFIQFICKFKSTIPDKLEVYFFKSTELDKDDYNKIGNYVTILIKVPIRVVNDEMIYYYIPLSDHWMWGHWRSRYQLKSIIWICIQLRFVNYHGYDINLSDLNTLSSGKMFPGAMLSNKITRGVWHPEDYIGNPLSFHNLETEESEAIERYIDSEGYRKLLRQYQ